MAGPCQQVERDHPPEISLSVVLPNVCNPIPCLLTYPDETSVTEIPIILGIMLAVLSLDQRAELNRNGQMSLDKALPETHFRRSVNHL